MSTDKADCEAVQGDVTGMAIPPGLDYTAMVDYAVKYWTNYNPAYRSIAGNDCTNFISQVLRASGWVQFKFALWTDDDNWWCNGLNQTRSCAGAENWSHFAPQRTTPTTSRVPAKQTGRGTGWRRRQSRRGRTPTRLLDC